MPYVTYLERRLDHPNYGKYLTLEAADTVGFIGSHDLLQFDRETIPPGYNITWDQGIPVIYPDESRIINGMFDMGFGSWLFGLHPNGQVNFSNPIRKRTRDWKPEPNMFTHPLAFQPSEQDLKDRFIEVFKTPPPSGVPPTPRILDPVDESILPGVVKIVAKFPVDAPE